MFCIFLGRVRIATELLSSSLMSSASASGMFFNINGLRLVLGAIGADWKVILERGDKKKEGEDDSRLSHAMVPDKPKQG